jgi:hypothetical protein
MHAHCDSDNVRFGSIAVMSALRQKRAFEPKLGTRDLTDAEERPHAISSRAKTIGLSWSFRPRRKISRASGRSQ